ncbi:Mobile element protein [Actinokineospora spheciospongiae]|uniref:Mobile element protein n=1 Tax=Actinokineospora spheciospongiae TaxID=909613 RepID=W7JE01_9PSEU|nr:Mobile element protein [Actinokineospora spheciospongiae]
MLTGPRTEVWGARYPAVIRLWKNAWAEFVPFPAFDLAVGRE